MADLKALFYRAAANALDNRGKPAQLARTDGTLYFTDDSGVTHYDRSWARVGEGDSRQETVVYLDKVAAQRDLPVRVDLVNGVDTVIGVDRARAVEFAGGSTSPTPMQFNLPSHTHGRLGPMPDYIEGLRFLPLQAHPTSPPSMAVTVEQGSYRWGSADEIWQTADSADLSAYIPVSATVKHFIILCLDRSTGALAVVDGDDITAAGGDALFGTGTLTADDVQTVLDAGINDAYWPLCAILFYNGMTTIKAKDIIFDLRPWGGEGGSSGSPGGSDTQIQYNNGGVFGGDAALTFDDVTKAVTMTGDLTISGAGQQSLYIVNSAVPSPPTLTSGDYLVIENVANANLAFVTGATNTAAVRWYKNTGTSHNAHVLFSHSSNRFEVAIDSTDVLTLSNAGQLALPITGSGGGLLIGGNVQLYQSATDELTIPDSVIVTGNFRVQASSPVFQFVNTGATDRNIAFDLTSSTFAIAQYTDALTLVGNRLQISMLASNLVLDAGSTELVLNQAGDDYDFRVEGVGQANGLLYDAANNRLGVAKAPAAGTLDVSGTILVGVGSALSSKLTAGITVDQGGANDEILALKSSEVAHGVTTIADTDTYGLAKKFSATQGGLLLDGLSEGTVGMALRGWGATADTTKGTGSNGFFLFNGIQTSGTGSTNSTANANIVSVRTVVSGAGRTVFLVDAEGDLHVDGSGSLATFDDHDDMALLTGLRASLMPDGHELRQRFADWVEDARPVLERAGIVTYNEDGHHFIAMRQLAMLQIDAMRQLHGRILELEARLA